MRISFLPRTFCILEPDFNCRHWKLQSLSKFFMETFQIIFSHFETLSKTFHQNSSLNVCKFDLSSRFLLFYFKILISGGGMIMIRTVPADAVKPRNVEIVLRVFVVASCINILGVEIFAESLISNRLLVLVEMRHEIRVVCGVIARPGSAPVLWRLPTVRAVLVLTGLAGLTVVTVEVTGQLGASSELRAAVVTPQAPPLPFSRPNYQTNLELVPLGWLSRFSRVEAAQMIEQIGLQVETSFTFLAEISLVCCDGFPLTNTRIPIKLESLHWGRKIISEIDLF